MFIKLRKIKNLKILTSKFYEKQQKLQEFKQNIKAGLKSSICSSIYK